MKTITPHTPGPWKTGNKYPTRIIGEQTNIAATALPDDESHPSNEQIANARLIAAAPELLDALQSCVSELNQLAFLSGDKLAGPAIQKGLDAIAKAMV